jgi:hypothetical protein
MINSIAKTAVIFSLEVNSRGEIAKVYLFSSYNLINLRGENLTCQNGGLVRSHSVSGDPGRDVTPVLGSWYLSKMPEPILVLARIWSNLT